MFERGERNRRADRARMASLSGYVGRNVGDQPYIMDLVYQEHFAGGVQISPPWGQTLVGTGDIVAHSNGGGPTAFKIQSGATASSSAIYDWTGVFSQQAMLNGYQRDASVRCRIAFSAIDGNAKLFFGFACSNGLGSVVDGLFFGLDGDVSTGNFICVARNGGIATTAILYGGGSRANIPVDTAWHDVSIICDSTAAAVRFYVDRQLAATLTTDLPSDASDYVMPHLSAQNGATATNRSVSIDVIVVAEAAP